MDALDNIPPFYIGQRVVYVTGLNMPKDSEHTVTDVKQNTCGCWLIKEGVRDGWCLTDEGARADWLEVIGNIYENPELISTPKQ